MEYQVKDIAILTGVTAKALHHYHRIGLLNPARVSESGYRIYGQKELERLQQILFYKELDFPLIEIKRLLDEQTDRLQSLRRQRQLLQARKRKLDKLLLNITTTIQAQERGLAMQIQEMFTGFRENEWQEILDAHILEQYLQQTDETLSETDTKRLNELAARMSDFLAEQFSQYRDAELTAELCQLRGDMAAEMAETTARLIRGEGTWYAPETFRRGIIEQMKRIAPHYLNAIQKP